MQLNHKISSDQNIQALVDTLMPCSVMLTDLKDNRFNDRILRPILSLSHHAKGLCVL